MLGEGKKLICGGRRVKKFAYCLIFVGGGGRVAVPEAVDYYMFNYRPTDVLDKHFVKLSCSKLIM